MATTEAENKQLVRTFVDEVFTEGNLDRLEEFLTDDYVEHTGAGAGDVAGVEAVREYYTGLQTAFPDLEVTIEDLVAEGNTVAQRSTQSATHEGEFMGLEPTGKSGDISGMVIYRIEDGKIAESWVQADMMGLMQQLGVMEPPG